MNAGLVALIGALVGGRAAYVIVNWGYYGSHPDPDIPDCLNGDHVLAACPGIFDELKNILASDE